MMRRRGQRVDRSVARRSLRRSWLSVVLASVLLTVATPSASAEATSPVDPVELPFVGSSINQAIDAVPIDPTHVLVTTVGAGTASHLGHFTFVSPHVSGLLDYSIEGPQFFTASDGSELHTHLSGYLEPVVGPDGTVSLAGDVPATITGGTGRFEHATGTFTFSLVFDLVTSGSTAQIDGHVVLSTRP